MSRAMSYNCRILFASCWLYLWLCDYCGYPYRTEADFYPTLKGDFLRLLGYMSIPAIWLVIDWGLRPANGTASRVKLPESGFALFAIVAIAAATLTLLLWSLGRIPV
jgi:hypothetical protein